MSQPLAPHTFMLRYRLPLLITLSLLCGLFAPKLTAQPVYPVRALTQLTPPYSVYLSDYAAPGVEQLRVMLVQNDLTKPATQIRLSMELQLNGRLVLRTSPAYRPAPLTLSPAMPLIVSGNNLSGFLEPQNLDFIGISRDNYLRTKALPEGAYTLSFTAYDYHRPQVRVSQPGVVAFYLSKSEPPLLNLPLDGQTLEATPLPSVLFQWTPRATASLNAAFDTEYKLQLFEVMVPGSNLYQVVNSSQPVFERSLSTSTYLYGPLDPTLVAGRQYLWRVQARDRSGRDRFRNQGFSQVYEFTYGQDLASQLPLIEDLTATTTGSRARINWTSNPAFDRYTLQYRRQGEYSWVDQSVTTLPVDIHQLAYDIPYECRVQGIQGVYKSQWSQPVSFTSPKPQPVACGTPYEPKAITNHQPITKLLPMQEVDAGGFTVTILQATPSGDRFSGRGYVQLPFWGNKRFAVTFSNIKVNTDFQLTDGRFVTVSDMVKNEVYNVDSITGKTTSETPPVTVSEATPSETSTAFANADTTITIAGTIDTVYYNANGGLVVVTKEGETTTIAAEDIPEGDTVAVTDTEGKEYVAAGGEITTPKDNLTASAPREVSYPYEQYVGICRDISTRTIWYCSTQGISPSLIEELETTLKNTYAGDADFVKNACTVKKANHQTFIFKRLKKISKESPLEITGNYTGAFSYFLNEKDFDLKASGYKIYNTLLTTGRDVLEMKHTSSAGKVVNIASFTILDADIPVQYQFRITREIVPGRPRTDTRKIGSTLGNEADGDVILKPDESITLVLEKEKAPGTGEYEPISDVEWKVNDNSAFSGERFSHVIQPSNEKIVALVDEIKMQLSLIVKPLSKYDNKNPNLVFNVITDPLNPNDREPAKAMYNGAIAKIRQSTASVNLYSFISGAVIRATLYPGNNPNITGYDGKSSSDLSQTYDYPLLDLANISKSTNNTIINAILARHLKKNESDAIKSSIQNKKLNPLSELILAKIAEINSPKAQELGSFIENGTPVTEEYIQALVIAVEKSQASDFLLVNTSDYMTVDLNYDALKSDENTFLRILAHEFLHLFWSKNRTYEKLKWSIIREKAASYGYTLSDSQPGNTNDNGYGCSAGESHERNNPENEFVCREQNNY